MKSIIIKKEENPLLKRTTYIVKVDFDTATPKRTEMVDEIAKIVKCEPSLVVVRKIRGVFGSKSCIVTASIYNDKASLDKVEMNYMKKRHGQEEKKEEAKTEEKKE